MKLLHQINLAFGLMLVLVLSVTAVIFHYVLMDHFIEVQKKDMTAIERSITSTIAVGDLTFVEPGGDNAVASMAATITAAPVAGVGAVITDSTENVVFSTVDAVPVWTSTFGTATAAAAPGVVSIQKLREAEDIQYLVSKSSIPQGTLTLFTPMSKIKEIELSLLGRLLIVLFVGGGLVFLLSLFITRRLIRPLLKLQGELQKVENRRFSEVRLIQAGGEIGDVAQTVYKLAGELEKYNRIQKQFIQNASHELKTPLMSIAGYAEGIRDGVFEGEQAGKGLNVIISESARLRNIVTEMTLLAKLDGEENSFRFGAVAIPELIEETVERLNPILVQNGITIETELDANDKERLTVRADRDKLLQALINVVGNAARYASQRIRIQVRIQHKQLVIAVVDDGRGIPDKLLPHLFHRFVKGKDGETGLGLAISRAIVERCGGRIAARNIPEGGAEMTMRFPGMETAATA